MGKGGQKDLKNEGSEMIRGQEDVITVESENGGVYPRDCKCLSKDFSSYEYTKLSHRPAT